eukprot:5304776-Amphidinium_carterae.1
MGSASRVLLVHSHMMVKGSRKNKSVGEQNHPKVEPTRTHLGVRQDHQAGHRSAETHLRELRTLHLVMVGSHPPRVKGTLRQQVLEVGLHFVLAHLVMNSRLPVH